MCPVPSFVRSSVGLLPLASASICLPSRFLWTENSLVVSTSVAPLFWLESNERKLVPAQDWCCFDRSLPEEWRRCLELSLSEESASRSRCISSVRSAVLIGRLLHGKREWFMLEWRLWDSLRPVSSASTKK